MATITIQPSFEGTPGCISHSLPKNSWGFQWKTRPFIRHPASVVRGLKTLFEALNSKQENKTPRFSVGRRASASHAAAESAAQQRPSTAAAQLGAAVSVAPGQRDPRSRLEAESPLVGVDQYSVRPNNHVSKAPSFDHGGKDPLGG